jgi:hypothetical protein
VAAFAQWGEWALEGAKTPTAWLDTRCHIPKAEARARLRRGEALAGLPVAAAAWARGDIGAAHLDTLVRVKSPVTEEALARDEGLLVDDARTMKFAPFCSAVAYWEHLADQDGTEEAALERAARRDVYLVPSVHGTYLGKINLDPLGGATVANELERLYDEHFHRGDPPGH